MFAFVMAFIFFSFGCISVSLPVVRVRNANADVHLRNAEDAIVVILGNFFFFIAFLLATGNGNV